MQASNMTRGKISPLPPGVRIMRRKLVGTLFPILGLMLPAGAAAGPTLAGTVARVSGSCTAGGRVLTPDGAVQVGDTVDGAGRRQAEAADGRRVDDFDCAGQQHDRDKLRRRPRRARCEAFVDAGAAASSYRSGWRSLDVRGVDRDRRMRRCVRCRLAYRLESWFGSGRGFGWHR